MHPHVEVIEKFYSCFRELDGDGMAGCYHEHVQFSDPVFTRLNGSAAGSMWKMLCSQAQGFELSFCDVHADEGTGKAHWEAKYDFSATGRRVHNTVEAEFQFQDGKIIRHWDRFSFWKWSFMALGPMGLVLGWSPLVKKKVQRQAVKNLENFIKTSGG